MKKHLIVQLASLALALAIVVGTAPCHCPNHDAATDSCTPTCCAIHDTVTDSCSPPPVVPFNILDGYVD